MPTFWADASIRCSPTVGRWFDDDETSETSTKSNLCDSTYRHACIEVSLPTNQDYTWTTAQVPTDPIPGENEVEPLEITPLSLTFCRVLCCYQGLLVVNWRQAKPIRDPWGRATAEPG